MLCEHRTRHLHIIAEEAMRLLVSLKRESCVAKPIGHDLVQAAGHLHGHVVLPVAGYSLPKEGFTW
jgi:hypothetical protein